MLYIILSLVSLYGLLLFTSETRSQQEFFWGLCVENHTDMNTIHTHTRSFWLATNTKQTTHTKSLIQSYDFMVIFNHLVVPIFIRFHGVNELIYKGANLSNQQNVCEFHQCMHCLFISQGGFVYTYFNKMCVKRILWWNKEFPRIILVHAESFN